MQEFRMSLRSDCIMHAALAPNCLSPKQSVSIRNDTAPNGPATCFLPVSILKSLSVKSSKYIYFSRRPEALQKMRSVAIKKLIDRPLFVDCRSLSVFPWGMQDVLGVPVCGGLQAWLRHITSNIVSDHAALLLVLQNCGTLCHRHFVIQHLHRHYSV